MHCTWRSARWSARLPGAGGGQEGLSSGEISSLMEKLASLEADALGPGQAEGGDPAASTFAAPVAVPFEVKPTEQFAALPRHLERASHSEAAAGALAPLLPRTPPVPAVAVPANPTLRIAASKLDGLLLQAEEMLTLKLTSNQRADDLRHLGGLIEAWEKEWVKGAADLRAVRESIEKSDLTARASEREGSELAGAGAAPSPH